MPRFNSLSMPPRSALLFALLWSTVVLLVAPIRPRGSIDQQLLSYTPVFITAFLTVLAVSAFYRRYLSRHGRESRFARKIIPSLVVFALSQAVLGVYFYLFYPGLISWDFYVQWFEAAGRIPLSDWHPVFHTLMIRLLSKVWFSPAIVVVAQIFIFGLLLVKSTRRLEAAGAPLSALIIIAIFYIFFPLNGFYMVSLWKDIAYAMALWWFTLLVIEIVSTQGQVLQRWPFQLQFALAMIFVALIRHNGLVPAFGTGLVLLVFFHKQWLPLLKATALTVLLIFLYKGVVFSSLDVNRKDVFILKAHLPVQHIGAILQSGGQLREEEKLFLDTICPLDYWQKAFDYLSCMPLIHGKRKDGSPYLDGPQLKDKEPFHTFLGIWMSLALRNPVSVLQYHLRASEFLWKVQSKAGIFIIPDGDLTADHLMDGYSPSSPLLRDRVSELPRQLIDMLKAQSTGWLLHRGALYFWLGLFFISLSLLYRKNCNTLLVATPFLLQSITLFVFPLVQDTRFIFPVILLAPLIAVFAFTRERSSSTVPFQRSPWQKPLDTPC